MNALAGKVAVVTGASRGIGRATAERLARDGAAVVINYAVSGEEAKAVVREVEAQGGKAIALQADIARLDDIARLFRETVARLGRLDIMVANAGYACFKPFTEITEEDFDRTYTLNAKGTYFCLKEALRHMTEGGRIVCVSTIGTVLNPPGGACYFGSKAAVEQFCRTLAKEVAPRGITVNVVSPGFTETAMLLANIDAEARRNDAARPSWTARRNCRGRRVPGQRSGALDQPPEYRRRRRHRQPVGCSGNPRPLTRQTGARRAQIAAPRTRSAARMSSPSIAVRLPARRFRSVTYYRSESKPAT